MMVMLTIMERLAAAIAWFSGAVFALACLALCASALSLWFALNSAPTPNDSRAAFIRLRDAIRGEAADLRSARVLKKTLGVLLRSSLIGILAIIVRIAALQK